MGSLQVQRYNNPLDVPEQQLLYATAGPMFVGFVVATVLWGVSSAQCILYFRRYPQESTQIRTIVIVILSLESFHLALTTHGVYATVINSRWDIAFLIQGPVWSMRIQVLPSVLIVAIVRYVWIMRVRALSRSHRKNIIAGAMMIFAIAEAGATIAWMIAGFFDPFWGEVNGIAWPVLVSFFVRAFNDISATVLLCYYLHQSKNGFAKTDSIIRKMVYYGLGSGFVVCIGSISLIIVMGLLPKQLWFLAIYVAFTRVYANSLIAMLNWRRPSGKDATALDVDEMVLSTARWTWSAASRLTEPGLNDT